MSEGGRSGRHGRERRLWIIDPSISVPERQGSDEVLGDWPGESRVFQPSLSPGDGPGPEAGYGADGVVVMGSAASVGDPLPWIGALAAWLEPILAGAVTDVLFSRHPVLLLRFVENVNARDAQGRVDDDTVR